MRGLISESLSLRKIEMKEGMPTKSAAPDNGIYDERGTLIGTLG
jgi:hypothetical protein